MADISVLLELDDSRYTGKLKAAESAAQSFGSQTVTHFRNVQGGMDKMSDGAEKINKKFESLTQVLVGAGIFEFTKSLLEGANQMKDLADGLGVSIERLMEMQVAAIQSGSSMEGMAKMLSKLEIAAGNAADGNMQLRNAFADVGISMRDLQRLSPDQVFARVAQALAGIENPAERARLKMELLGKGAFSFDPVAYVSNIQKVYGSMDSFGESQRRAADLSEQLKLKTELVKTAFLGLLEPLLVAAETTGSFSDQMDKAKIIADILAVSLGVIVSASVVNGFKTLFGLVSGVTTAMGLNIAATEGATAATFELSAAEMALLKIKEAESAARALSLEATIAESRARLTELAATEADVIATAELAAAKRALMIASGQLAGAQATSAGATAALAAAETAAIGPTAGLTAAGAGLTGVFARLAPLVAAAAAALAIFYSPEVNAGEDVEVERMRKLGEALKSMTEEQRQRYWEMTDEERKRIQDQLINANEMKKSQDLMNKITGATGGAEPGKGMVGNIDTSALNASRNRARAIEFETQQMNANNQRSLERIKLETDLLTVSTATKSARLAAFDAETKYLNDIAKIDTEILKLEGEKALKKGEEASNIQIIIDAYKKQKLEIKSVADETQKFKDQQIDVSRQWSTGWNKAFNEYADNATNAAMEAEVIFKKATQGMEDAIVNFTKTGKFEWKNFLAMMVEELLRSQIRQTMVNIMGGLSGVLGGGKSSGGGLISGIKSLFGFAQGGVVGANAPILVGERGPEIFMPPSGGSIVPNNQLGSSGGSVTYNINAVDAPSFQALLARNPQFLYAVTEMGRRTMPGVA